MGTGAGLTDLGVVLERLVGSTGQVEVKPHHTPVVTADDQVVPRRMHVHGADPFAPTDELLHHHLKESVIHNKYVISIHHLATKTSPISSNQIFTM